MIKLEFFSVNPTIKREPERNNDVVQVLKEDALRKYIKKNVD